MSPVEVAFDLLQPSNSLFLLLVVGTGLAVCRIRAGVWLCVVGLAAVAIVTVLPVGEWLLGRIEAHVRPVPVVAPLDGIVVLGGFIDAELSERTGKAELNDVAERLTEATVLAHQFQNAAVIITDGAPDGVRSGAAIAADLMAAMGVARDRILVEPRARSTWDNAVFSHDLVGPSPAQRYALVTSASHMPRALATFREAGWPDMIPVPVSYTMLPGAGLLRLGPMRVSEGLRSLDDAAREWMALAYYRWRGITDRLLPTPPAEHGT